MDRRNPEGVQQSSVRIWGGRRRRILGAGWMAVLVSVLVTPDRNRAAPATQPIRSTLVQVDQWGGRSDAVEVVGGTTYLAMGTQVMIVDTRDPRTPTPVGRYVAFGPIEVMDLEVRRAPMGDADPLVILYAIDSTGMLHVVDATEPGSPTVWSRLQLGLRNSESLGHAAGRLFVAYGEGGLTIIETSDLLRPRRIDYLPGIGPAAIVVESADLVFIGSRGTLRVLDAKELRVLASVTIGSDIRGVVVQRGVLYATVFRRPEAGAEWKREVWLVAVDISQPAALGEAGSQLIPDAEDAPALAVAGDTLYILKSWPSLWLGDVQELAAFSVVDPFVPRVRPDGLLMAALGTQVAAGVDTLFVSVARGGLQVVSALPGVRPRAIARIDVPMEPTAVAAGRGRVLMGDRATGIVWIRSRQGDAFRLNRSEAYPGLCSRRCRFVMTESAALGVDTNYGFVVLELDGPNGPHVIGRLADIRAESAAAVAADYAVVVSRTEPSLSVIRITDPSTPMVVSELRGLGSLAEVTVEGEYVYAVGHDGLHVIDIADPGSPVVVGSVAVAGSFIRTMGNMALVATHGAGLEVVDVGTPAFPRRLGGVPAVRGVPATGLEVNGARAHVVYEDGIRTIDVSDPTVPRDVGTLRVDYSSSGSAAHEGDDLYVVDPWRGLFTYGEAPPLTQTYLPQLDR